MLLLECLFNGISGFQTIDVGNVINAPKIVEREVNQADMKCVHSLSLKRIESPPSSTASDKIVTLVDSQFRAADESSGEIMESNLRPVNLGPGIIEILEEDIDLRYNPGRSSRSRAKKIGTGKQFERLLEVGATREENPILPTSPTATARIPLYIMPTLSFVQSEQTRRIKNPAVFNILKFQEDLEISSNSNHRDALLSANQHPMHSSGTEIFQENVPVKQQSPEKGENCKTIQSSEKGENCKTIVSPSIHEVQKRESQIQESYRRFSDCADEILSHMKNQKFNAVDNSNLVDAVRNSKASRISERKRQFDRTSNNYSILQRICFCCNDESSN